MLEFISRKIVLSVALIATSVTSIWATDVEDINHSLHQIGQAVHQKLPQDENQLFCPLGVAQTLTALHAVADKNIQEEIERFIGNSNIETSVAALNQQLTSLPKREGDKSIFANNNYAVLANSIQIKPETDQKFKRLGVKPLTVDFSKSDETAQVINDIVNRDTNGKIKELFSPNDLSADDIFILLHTLYVKDKWKMYGVDDCCLEFQDQKNISKLIKGFEIKGNKFQFYQKQGTTYLALPTQDDYHVVIRHNENDVRPISASEIDNLLKSETVYTRSVKVPFVSMKAEHNLKNLLAIDLPEVLTQAFSTELCNQSIEVDQYIQKLTFDMNDQGIEASAVTFMRCGFTCVHSYSDGPKIVIDSPFSFALVKKFENQILLLFLGQVVDQLVTEVIPHLDNSEEKS